MLLQQNNTTYPPKKHHYRRTFVWTLLIIWAASLGMAFVNRQNLQDWWKLRNYQAPTIVSTIATQDTMTDYGRKLLYVNKPRIADKTAFGKACPNNGGEQTIVLGCYHGNQNGIFVLDVTDSRLDGVEQVTAAHEMLHAAYDRLNSSEKNKVDGMLLDYFGHNLKDARVKSVINAYRKSEPHDVVNEMHSIFGTEISNLPAPLEQYYTRYFTDRKAVATFAEDYQGEFTSRQELIKRDDSKLGHMKTQIEAAQSTLNSKLAAINSQQTSLTTKRNNGDIAGYNTGVPIYNKLVNAYNAQLDETRGLIETYNKLVAERNAVALEEDQLVKDLSSPAAPLRSN